jgi:error-prone DNA polymerase
MGTDVDLSFLIAVSACIESARPIFDDKNHGLWLGVVLHQAADDDWWLMQLDDCASRAGVPLVAAGGVLMHARSRKPLHDVLTAVRLGTPVADCGQALLPNAQAHLRTRLQLGRLYPPDLLANTLEVARRCTFSLTELRYHYPLETVGAGETPSQTLARLTWAGAAWRYGVGEVASRVALNEGEAVAVAAPPRGGPPSAYCEQKLSGGPPLARANHAGAASENQNKNPNPILTIPEKVKAQIEHELALIAELGYEMYFLTVHDLVRFARSRDILCQGRGSACQFRRVLLPGRDRGGPFQIHAAVRAIHQP